MFNIGDMAPDFLLEDSEGNKVSPEDFRGRKVVLYFYPKDDTPGCTKEACSFRDVYDDILDTGAAVIGISTDDTQSHTRFRKKYGLPFHLLSDPDHKTAEAYGAWGEKSMYGRKYLGTLRKTFILDEKGHVLKVYDKVSPDKHGSEVLEALRAGAGAG